MSDLMKKLDEYFENLPEEKFQEINDIVDKELQDDDDENWEIYIPLSKSVIITEIGINRQNTL